MIVDEADAPSKKAIVAAALKLFVRDGYKETTIRAIADEAGYTNPALFKFFASKDELGAYVFARCHRFVVAHIDAGMLLADADDDAPLALDVVMTRWVTAFLDLVAAHRDIVLFVHEYAPTFGGSPDPYARLIAWLRRARASGRVSTVAPERLQALMIVGTLHHIAKSIDLGVLRSAERKKLIAATAHLLTSALRA